MKTEPSYIFQRSQLEKFVSGAIKERPLPENSYIRSQKTREHAPEIRSL